MALRARRSRLIFAQKLRPTMKQFLNLYLFLTLSSAVPYSFASSVPSVETLPVVDHGVRFSLSLDSVTDQAREHCIQGEPESAAGSLGKGLGSRPQHCKCSYRITLPSGLVALLLFQRSTAIASIATLGCASAQRLWSPPLLHRYNVKPRLKPSLPLLQLKQCRISADWTVHVVISLWCAR
jgi:hypothetical protein